MEPAQALAIAAAAFVTSIAVGGNAPERWTARAEAATARMLALAEFEKLNAVLTVGDSDVRESRACSYRPKTGRL